MIKMFLVFTKKLNKANPYPKIKISDNYKALLYMPRKLLRPGDKENILVVVKDNDFRAVNKLPLKLIVKDPIGFEVIKKKISLNSNGLTSVSLNIPVYYKTGNYQVKLIMANRVIGNTIFKVEDFFTSAIGKSN